MSVTLMRVFTGAVPDPASKLRSQRIIPAAADVIISTRFFARSG